MRNKVVINLGLSVLMTLILGGMFYQLMMKLPNNTAFKLIWGGGSAFILCCFYAYTFWWLPTDAKIDKLKEATIVAIIPSYNEDPELLKETILSIKRQSFPVAAIHVVDDGSNPPVIPFDCPDVVWHVQSNQGKRYAQALALNSINEATTDFILTVDSDSVLASDAVAHLLMKFERDDQVKGCTGFVITRNYNKNLLTRLTDLNIGISCALARPVRSITGSLETTSGALAMYHKDIFFDNIEHYVTSGTYSDDRQLCLYSVMSGKAVGIQEAVVYSAMPETVSGFLKQRKRWGKGGWKYFPFQVTNLSFIDLFFPFMGMLQWLTMPFFLVVLVYSIWSGSHSFVLFYALMRVTIRYLEAAMYLVGAPHMTAFEKIVTWLFITPLELLVSSVVLVVVKFFSLLSLREEGWLTRG